MDNGGAICPLLPKNGSLINALPDGKILNWSKFKAFADDKINVTEKMNFV